MVRRTIKGMARDPGRSSSRFRRTILVKRVVVKQFAKTLVAKMNSDAHLTSRYKIESTYLGIFYYFITYLHVLFYFIFLTGIRLNV